MEAFVIDRCRRDGKLLPESMEKAPELFLGLELYWKAYVELNSCRPAGFGGALPIPWNMIWEYAAIHEFDEKQAERLYIFVNKMDAEFLKWWENKYGDKSKPQTVRQTNAPRRGPIRKRR